MQHVRAMLPDLKLCISTQMIMLQKELTSYMRSSLIPSQVKVALLLNIISKYSYGFQSIVDGKYEEWSSTELSGVVCLQYIFQAIFVTSLEVYILLILDTGCYTGDVMRTYLSVLEHVLQIYFPM
jgi:dynamin 1-like protein